MAGNKESAASEYHDNIFPINLPQAFRDLKFAKRLAIDIGGSLTKVSYVSTFSRKRTKHQSFIVLDKTDDYSKPLATSFPLYEVREEEECGERLHFVKFETKFLEKCLDFIQENLYAPTEQDSTEKHRTLKVTGGGAYKYKDEIAKKLNVRVDKEDEMHCLIKGCNFILHNIPNEVFEFRRDQSSQYVFKNLLDYDLFPYLLVNIGSGVSIIKVESFNSFVRVGGTSMGGGTFWGLGSLLTSAKGFDELLELAIGGQHSNVDMLVKDIYGGDYSLVGLPGDLTASSFGKAVRSVTSDTNPNKTKAFSEKDIAKSLLHMISNDIGQLASLHAKLHGLKRIIFGGFFIRGYPITMHTITFAINYWSKGEQKALFLRHEGYLGAIGAFLTGAEEEAVANGTPFNFNWGENYAGSSGLPTKSLKEPQAQVDIKCDVLELDRMERSLVPFPLLHHPSKYHPDTEDLTADIAAREYWLDCFAEGLDVVVSRAIESQPELTDAKDRASQFKAKYLERLNVLRRKSFAYGNLTVRSLLDTREQCLNEFQFSDPFAMVKQRENEAALLLLSKRLEKLDKLSWYDRQVEIVEGILAGNVFDWGAKEVVKLMEKGELKFDTARKSLQARPWLDDDLDEWIERLKGQPHRMAVMFVDNSGADIVLGVFPFARELLSRGTVVVLAANSLPALNDVTYSELEIITEKVAAICPIIKQALDKKRLLIMESGTFSPCLDLRRVDAELVETCVDADLIILEGMGRTIHTNYDALFTCESLKMAVIKNKCWMNSLLKKGYKQALDDSDVGEVLPRDSTECLTDNLQRYWEHEVKISKKPSLFVPLAKLAGTHYFSSLIYMILEESNCKVISSRSTVQLAVRLIQPIFIGKIVGVFQSEELDKRSGYTFAAIIGICAFTEAIIHHPLFLEFLRTGMHLRVALSALVYRKALRMSQASLSFTNTGQIVNLVTNDVQKIEEATLFSLYLLVAPFLIGVACYFCWVEIGYSFLPGMALLFFLTPFQSWLGRFFAALRVKTAILRDERIKIMNEVICGMRVIKMYTWEHAFAKIIGRVRKEETKQILKTCRLLAINAAFYLAAIPMVTLSMFIPYILTGNILSSEKVFTVIGIVGSVNIVTSVFVPKSITALKESGVSLSRIKRFLQLDEGLTLSTNKVEVEQSSVVVQNVYSSWDKKSTCKTLSDVSFQVSAGELLMVIGPVGCGKSSLLMALLREHPVISGDICLSGSIAYVSQLPWVFSGTLKENILFGKEYDTTKYQEVIRVCALEKDIENLIDGDETLVGERGVSLSGGQKARVNLARAVYLDASIYIMDDPLSAVDSHVSKHIFNECIRGSLKSKVCILVSHQLQYLNDANRILCLQEGKVVGYGNMKSLQEEGIDILSMIEVKEENNGDKEVVVSKRKLERHLSHSPGMSRRKNRLRNGDKALSLYGFRSAETDQLLESSDQSPHVQFKAKSAHDIGKYIAAESDIAFHLSPRFTRAHDLKPRSASFQPMIGSHLDIDLIDIEDVASQEGEDAKELAESRTTGSITFKVYKDFFLAGAKPAVIFLCGVIFLAGQVVLLLSEWWLAKWSNWEESTLKRNDSARIIDEKRPANISIYVGLVVFLYLVAFVRTVMFFQIIIAASRHLHDKMFNALLRAPIYFFDSNPVGRILNRFSKDIGLVDDVLPVTFFDAAQLSVLALAIILMSISSQPYASIAIVPIVIIFVVLRQYYVRSSREIKRLEARSRSPLYSHISATLQGLATIRASEEQHQFLNIYNKYQDYNSSAWFYYLAANRWLGFRLDILCALLMTCVSFAPFIAVEAGVSVSPVLVGLSLIYTKRLTGMFQFCVRQSAEVENQMVSVERIQEYTHIEPEAELDIEDQTPSANWPEHGTITGQNVRFSYHPSLPNVLDNISFNIKAKEKIGIVGRTGAGKSSLISALFRMAEPKGKLMIDGVCITKIGLHDLRGRLSIIPQDPVIFAGSVRSNLDPFANHTDVELWDALQQVQLSEVVDNFPEKLEFLLTESGNNLSVGQRQLICLARAVLKHNKILIIDEATANVDLRTDHLIQETIRDKFKDCTVLTIAHRLNTIVDADRIMVLDAGRVIEFEEPYELLQRPDSEFSKLVEQTGKQNALKLKRMARIAHEKRSCQ